MSYKGESTKGLFGFTTKICSLINQFNPKGMVVCKDSPPYARKRHFEEYKADRKKERDPDVIKEIRSAWRMSEEFLSITGIPVWAQPGLEADDLMAVACDLLGPDYDRAVLVSTDTDLYQLFRITSPAIFFQRLKVFYGLENFKNQFPLIDPNDWPKITALAGSHNGAPGIRGLGMYKASKIVSDEVKWKEVYSNNKSLIDLYLDLATLPYPREEVELERLFNIRPKDLDYGRATRYLLDHGISPTQKIKQALGSLNI